MIPGRFLPLGAGGILFSVLILGCDQASTVRSTVPLDGEENVDPQTSIRVTFSSTFNSSTDKQDRLTDPENFQVTGQNGLRYTGTVKVSSASGVSTTTEGEEGQRTDETKDSKDSKKTNGTGASGRSENNTLVFTLGSGASFRQGERVSVRVKGSITVRGRPVQSHHFSFRVRGEAARPALGDLRVESTSPAPEQLGVVLRPRVSARFTQPVKPEAFPGAMTIRGASSGVHRAGETVFPKKASDQTALEVAQRLSADDEFLPGEWVTVTLTDEILGTAASGAAPATGGTNPQAGPGQSPVDNLLGGAAGASPRLPPHTFRFQVLAGRAHGPWTSAWKSTGSSEPLWAVAGDLRPTIEGTEFAFLASDRVDFFWQKAPLVWESVRLDGFGHRGRLIDGQIADLDGDGVSELVLLTSRDNSSDRTGSFVLSYLVGAAGGLVEKGEALELPAVRARRIFIADLDNNGFVDLLITHPNRQYTAEGTGGPRPASTGTLTILEKSRGAPDLSRINPNDPTSFLGVPAFHLLENPLPDLPLFERIEARDLDGDGKEELIVETAGEGGVGPQLLLVQNRGTRSERFRFKVQRALRGRDGSGTLAPRAWTLSDVDGDNDVDLLAWDETGSLLYTNRFNPATQDPARPEARGLLFEDVLPEPVALPAVPEGGFTPLALDLNGDRTLDLVLPDGSGRAVLLHLGLPGRTLEFEVSEARASVGGRLARVAVADADGDGGLDLIALGDGSSPGPPVEILRPARVEPLESSIPSSFSIDPELSAATEDDIAVVVTADIADSFTGYTVVLDYDEGRLQFHRFEEPPNFRGVATFTPCPDLKGEGCAGFSSAKMAFTQNSRGIKGQDVVLGTFRFKPRSVSEPARTAIFLAGNLTGSDGKKIQNSLNIIDGQSQSEAEVKLEGEPFVVSLAPLRPPLLAITACEVLDSAEGVFPARVAWTSPADALFSGFDVSVDGVLLQKLGSLERETYPFHLNTGGSHQVKVVAFGLSGEPVASVECVLSTVFQPDVNCTQVMVNQKPRNRITWSIAGQVDRFQLSKNGAPYKTVPGNVFSDEDLDPSQAGADVYEVSGVIERPSGRVVGPPGGCAVNDPFPNRTDPPRELRLEAAPRSSSGDPLSLRLSWANTEAYDRLRLRIFTEAGAEVHREDLPGTRTEHLFSADAERGGVPPQIYRFSLVAEAGGVSSEEKDAISFLLPVALPSLGSAFACEAPEGSNVVLRWDPVWGGYSGLALTVRGPDGTREIPFPAPFAQEFRETIVPVGTYEYTLRARYDPALPTSLRPNLSSLERRCTLTFRPLLRLGTVETGVGLLNVLVPIRADLFSPTSGLRFALLFPEELRVQVPDPLHPESTIRLNGDHPQAEISATLGPGPNGPEGRPRRKIEVEVTGANFPAGRDQTLLWVVGSVDPDFARAGRYPLRFDGEVRIVPQVSSQPLPIQVEDAGADLLIRKRFTVVDRVRARVGDPQPTVIRVLLTFDKPRGFERPEDYRLLGFSIHLTFDPNMLDLLPLTDNDQLETVMGSTGLFFYPTGGAFEAVRRSGNLEIGWIGLIGQQQGTITPGINQPILFLKFLPKVPDTPGGAFARIRQVSPPSEENPTMLIPEKVANDGPVLEAWFDGGIDIAEVEDIPTLLSVVPATGSLVGGGEAVVNGFGFLAGVREPEKEIELKLVYRPTGAPPLSRPVEWIPGRTFRQNLLEFRVPSAGLTSPSLFATRFDVELRTPKGRSILVEAYQYEYLRLTAADISSGGVTGGDLLTITGFGMAPLTGGPADTRVVFQVRGGPEFPAEVLEVAPDGRRLVLRTPAMPGQGGKLADVRVILPTLLKKDGTPASDLVPQPFTIRHESEALTVTAVEPAGGSICGGEKVMVRGSGFTASLQVRLGAELSPAVQVLDSGRAEVVTPPVPETTRAVAVSVSINGGSFVERPDAFTYRDSRPPFIRGDADGDGVLRLNDAIAISDFVTGARAALPHLDSADANDDGLLDTGDLVAVTHFLFLGAAPLPPPGPTPGFDPTPDGLRGCSPRG